MQHEENRTEQNMKWNEIWGGGNMEIRRAVWMEGT